MNAQPVAVRANLLLASLPDADRSRLQSQLTHARLKRGDVLCEPGMRLHHLYFPTSAVISLRSVSESGVSTELALTGREGAVGVGLFLGGMPTTLRAEVHVAGDAWRLPASRVQASFDGAVQRVLLRFALALMTQISQAVVCNRHHSVEQALCRWLLMIHDRVESDELQVTQLLIADSLGVRREGITEAAGRLQEAGCIRYARGLIKILDRGALARRSCECYAVVSREFALLFGNESWAELAQET